ncbi:MAG: cyclase family protein [Limnochordia bacterium]|nr:cyclase family protein [Limnochordia bacterium]
MKIVYDVSMTIEPKMQVYKNREHLRPEFITTAEHDKQGIHQTRVCLDLHTGTHLDAPLHMVPDGATIDDYPLEEMLVPCQVFDLTHVHEKITAADIEDLPIASGKFVLFKTKNSKRKDLKEDFIYVDLTAARTLVSKRAVGVGIDALGIERDQAGHMTHRILFQAGIKILEGLCLGHVPPGSYTLLVAPLKFQGVEAALVRALLLE